MYIYIIDVYFFSSYKVKVTMEAMDEELIFAAYKKMLELLPNEYIVNINKD